MTGDVAADHQHRTDLSDCTAETEGDAIEHATPDQPHFDAEPLCCLKAQHVQRFTVVVGDGVEGRPRAAPNQRQNEEGLCQDHGRHGEQQVELGQRSPVGQYEIDEHTDHHGR